MSKVTWGFAVETTSCSIICIYMKRYEFSTTSRVQLQPWHTQNKVQPILDIGCTIHGFACWFWAKRTFYQLKKSYSVASWMSLGTVDRILSWPAGSFCQPYCPGSGDGGYSSSACFQIIAGRGLLKFWVAASVVGGSMHRSGAVDKDLPVFFAHSFWWQAVIEVSFWP